MFDTTPQYDFKDVLFKPKTTTLNSRNDVQLETTFTFSNNTKWTGIPIISANMYTTGTFEVHKELAKYKMLTAMHKFFTIDDYKKYDNEKNIDYEYCIVSCGIRNEDYDNVCQILDEIPQLKWICIDIANGYIPNMKLFCTKIRQRYPKHIIIAGNVATGSGVIELSSCGVDIVKVGIGPGSVCTTRKMTGIGVPQLSCIIECKKACEKTYIIGDGGITCAGDVYKAFGGGADFVMMGGVWSGHDENISNIIEKNNKKYKQFYGMSSTYAMKTHYGKKDDYRASEGKVVEVPYKGKIEDTILEYLGGIRSTCTYIGSKSIRDIKNNTTFIVVKNQLNTIFNDGS